MITATHHLHYLSLQKIWICEDINTVIYSGTISAGGGIRLEYNEGYNYGTYYPNKGWLDNNSKNDGLRPLEIHYLGNVNYGINYGGGVLTFECDGAVMEALLPAVSIPAGGHAPVLYVDFNGYCYYDKSLTQPAPRPELGASNLLDMKNQLASVSVATSQLIEKIKKLLNR